MKSNSPSTQLPQINPQNNNNRVSSNLKQPTSFKQKLGQGIKNMFGNKPPPQTASSSVFQIGGGPSGENSSKNNARPQSMQQSPASQYQHVHLEIQKIIGTSANSDRQICILTSNICIYTAQSYIVFYDFINNKQMLIVQNPLNPQKPYRVLKHHNCKIFAGEGNSKQCDIHLFNVKFLFTAQQVTGVEVQLEMILKGHKYGISDIFSQQNWLISIGDENDKGLLVWDISNPRLVSANMINAQINGVVILESTNEESLEFITYGSNKHFKRWKVELQKQQLKVQKLEGLKLKLDQDPSFCLQSVIQSTSLAFILGYTATQTHDHKAYILLKYNLLTEQVLSQIKQPFSSQPQFLYDYSAQHLLLTGSFKRLQLLDKQTFKFDQSEQLAWASPPQKGQLHMVTQEIYDYLVSTNSSSDAQYTQISGIVIEQGVIVQLMADGMLLFHDLAERRLIRGVMAHNEQVNEVVIREYIEEQNVQFITCSKDNTVRLWSSYIGDPELQSMLFPDQTSKPIENDLNRIESLDYDHSSLSSFRPLTTALSSIPEDQGLKSLAYNPLNNHLAVGDMLGNIRVYQLSQEDPTSLTQLTFLEAHDGRVATLQYSEPFSSSAGDKCQQFLMSMSSSDRMIHLFNAMSEEYELVQSIDCHRHCGIVDARFIRTNVCVKSKNQIVHYEKQLRLYSASPDKTLFCHRYCNDQSKNFIPVPLQSHQQMQSQQHRHSKIHKLLAHDQSVYLAMDQGLVEERNIDSWKVTQTMQQQSKIDYILMGISSNKELVVLQDRDKTLQVRDLKQIHILYSKIQLADHISSLQFTPDSKYLICSSAQGGLIYIYKLEYNQQLIKQSIQKIKHQRNQENAVVIDEDNSNSSTPFIPFAVNDVLPQRKFTVRNDLFNTWAKSSSISNSSNIPSQQQPSIIEQDDEDALQSALMSQNERRKMTLAPKCHRPRPVWDKDQQESYQLEFESENTNTMSKQQETTFGRDQESSIEQETISRNSLTKQYLVGEVAEEPQTRLTDKLKQKFSKLNKITEEIIDVEVDDMSLKERSMIAIEISNLIGKLNGLQGRLLKLDDQ